MNVDILITLVHSNTPIWDKTDKRHGNLKHVDKLWDGIADEMNFPKKSVKDKWKNLRDQFRTYLTKFPELRNEKINDTDHPYEPSWPYFKLLYFLKDQIKQKAISGVLSNEGERSNNKFTENNFGSQSNYLFHHLDPEQKKKVKEGETQEVHTGKRSLDGSIDRDQKKRKVIELCRLESKSVTGCSDSDESFFNSLLPHLKFLTPRDRMLCQMDIQKVVFEYVYGSKRVTDYFVNHHENNDFNQQHDGGPP